MPAADDDGAPRRFALHFRPDAELRATPAGVEGATLTLPLEVAGGDLPPALRARWPHLGGCTALALAEEHWGKVPELLRGQLAVTAHAADDGAALAATSLQTAGVVDELFATMDAPLGARWDDARGRLVISVWAPTAQSVELLHYGSAPRGDAPPPAVHPMARGDRGVWSLEAPREWDRT